MSDANNTDETQRIARRYFNAWTRRDAVTTASCLAEDFRFGTGPMEVSGRDAFLNANAFPKDAVTKMVAEAYQDGIGFQLYDSTNHGHTVRIAEQLTVRDGLIRSSQFVTDMAALQAFMKA